MKRRVFGTVFLVSLAASLATPVARAEQAQSGLPPEEEVSQKAAVYKRTMEGQWREFERRHGNLLSRGLPAAAGKEAPPKPADTFVKRLKMLLSLLKRHQQGLRQCAHLSMEAEALMDEISRLKRMLKKPAHKPVVDLVSDSRELLEPLSKHRLPTGRGRR